MSIIKQGKKDNLTYEAFSDRAEMGAAAARDIAAEIKKQIAEKGEINMIFAAAPSQNDVLAALVADKSIDWTKIHGFHMDEYIGLPAGAKQSFGNFLKEAIFGRVPFASVEYINSTAMNPNIEAERYAAVLAQNKCDIIVMGIGENGHIAFNDPHVADFNDHKAVKVVMLDDKCRMQQVHDGCFDRIESVPRFAITLTIPTLVAPDAAFCIVPAATKAEAVKRTLTGEIGTDCPATALRSHKNAKLYLDADSASLI